LLACWLAGWLAGWLAPEPEIKSTHAPSLKEIQPQQQQQQERRRRRKGSQ
jgi:hypothetical protein